MIMVGHPRRLSQPLRPGRREILISAGVGVVLVLAVVLSIALSGGAQHRAGPCVTYTLATSTGGATDTACGAGARRLCLDALAPGGARPELAPLVGAQCRRAGLLNRR